MNKERLTEWIDDGEDRYAVPRIDLRRNGYQACCNKLAEYEDLEEQGRLLKIPCKEIYLSSGDSVYLIYDDEITECVNCGLSMDADGKLWIALACDEDIFPYRLPDPGRDLDPTDWCKNTTEVLADEFGNTVFLTKSEAEAKLKELKAGEPHD